MVEPAAYDPLPPRPQWHDIYFHDLAGLQRYCEETRAWQRNSDDPFERANEAVWSRLTLQQSQRVFCRVIDLFADLDATDAIGKAYRAATSTAGGTITETEFREHFACVLRQRFALAIVHAAEA